MRQTLFLGLILILLAACTTTPTSSQLPPPTSAPIDMRVADMNVSLRTLPGWYAYVEDERIILADHSAESSELIVHIWFPSMNISTGQHVSDVVRQVADTTRGRAQIIASDPVRTTWSEHEATYFWLDDSQTVSLVLVIRVSDDRVVALNISGLAADARMPVETLSNLFSQFSVNGQAIGAAIFSQLAHRDDLPRLNPASALQPSNEP